MAVTNKTYNNVINTLTEIAEDYFQISTVSVGDIYSINLEKMQKFPLMHINPVNVQTGESTLTYIISLMSKRCLTKRYI